MSIGKVVECWLAANECDAYTVQRVSKELGIIGYDMFNKPVLAVLAESIGYDWRKGVDNGVWKNSKTAIPLTAEEIEEEIDVIRKAQLDTIFTKRAQKDFSL